MTLDPGWELYRSFLGVLEGGSLSGAARTLGITQPTVGRHISSLEASLGLVLFTRSQSGLAPTESALALRPYAESLRTTVAALRRAADGGGKGIKGTVRVSASEVVGVEILPPIIARLRQAYRQLSLELVVTNRLQDLLQREADIAVRMMPPRQEALIARRVGVVPVGLFAHKDYLARHGTPRHAAELSQHVLIGFDQETPFIRSASKALPDWNRRNFSIRTDSDNAQLALIRAGCGIGAYQVLLARRHQDLVPVLPNRFQLNLDTWITMHKDLRNSESCKAAFHALAEGMVPYVR